MIEWEDAADPGPRGAAVRLLKSSIKSSKRASR
jgi:hypothetical protein